MGQSKSIQSSRAPEAPPEDLSSADVSGTTDRSELAAGDKSNTQANESPGAGSRTISIGGKVEQKKKVSPIKPVIAPVQTGLISPSTQEIPEGSPMPAQKEKQRIVLNFEKADIAEVTSQIFSDQLKLNYVMDQTLQGRISMYIDGDFDNHELLQMVTRAYEANGISIIPKKGFYFIQLSQKTGGAGLPVADAKLLGEEKGTRPLVVVYRLRFMDIKQASNLITPFLTPGRKILTDTITNSLIFVEDADNAKVLVNLLKTIDINVLQEISMEIVPVYSIAPQDAVQGMEALMNKLGGLKESALKNSLALMPLNNFGGVLVMAQNPELLKSARQWIQALDVHGLGTQEEIYVYFVQNGLARDIAQIVSGVLGITGGGTMGQAIVPSGRSATRSAFGGTGMGGTGMGGTGFGGTGMGGTGMGGTGFGGTGFGGTGFGSTGSTMGGTGAVAGSTYGSTASRTTGTGTTAGGAAGTGARGTGVGGKPPGSIFTGEVMIIPDEVNNAIVVRANAVDYAKIKKTIETLDILPRAVLVEVTIAEVDLTKDFSYGLQYFFMHNPQTNTGFGLSFGGLTNNPSTSTTSSTTTGATFSPGQFPIDIGGLAGQGVAMSWVASAQDLAVLLTALASKTNVTILSTPTLLATDNTQASISVGGQQPIPTGTVSGTTTGADLYSTIQYQATGVILNIIPHINAGGLVRIELEQQVIEPGANATVGANNTAPTFIQREINTTLLAQDGRTIIIGGIIQSNHQVGKTGIPWLQDIPLLSPLFAARMSSLNRTELLVAITPHVIDQRGSQAPAELLQKLKNLRRRAGE
jgi:general secretion pathway protein D